MTVSGSVVSSGTSITSSAKSSASSESEKSLSKSGSSDSISNSSVTMSASFSSISDEKESTAFELYGSHIISVLPRSSDSIPSHVESSAG